MLLCYKDIGEKPKFYSFFEDIVKRFVNNDTIVHSKSIENLVRQTDSLKKNRTRDTVSPPSPQLTIPYLNLFYRLSNH